LHPFNPDLVVNKLKTHKEIDFSKDSDVRISHNRNVLVQRTTPDLQSSDVKAALSASPTRSATKRIKECNATGITSNLRVQIALNHAQLVQDQALPQDAFMRVAPDLDYKAYLQSHPRHYYKTYIDNSLPKLD
jgi:hypothetical protein